MHEIHVLVGGQHGQCGGSTGPEGESGRNDAAEIIRDLRFPAAAGDLSGQAVRPDLVLVDRAAEVECGIAVAPGVDPGLDIAKRFRGRALADEIDRPPVDAAAVKSGGGPFEDLDALQDERIDVKAAEAVLIKRQIVEEDARLPGIEAADEEPVGIGIKTIGLRKDASGVTQRLVDLLRLTIFDLLAADDGDRLRDLLDGRVRLRTRGGAIGHIAVHGTCPRSDLPFDGHGLECDLAGGRLRLGPGMPARRDHQGERNEAHAHTQNITTIHGVPGRSMAEAQRLRARAHQQYCLSMAMP